MSTMAMLAAGLDFDYPLARMVLRSSGTQDVHGPRLIGNKFVLVIRQLD
jgi:hypothetical protein